MKMQHAHIDVIEEIKWMRDILFLKRGFWYAASKGRVSVGRYIFNTVIEYGKSVVTDELITAWSASGISLISQD